MSKYTTEVRFICENAYGLVESAGFSKIDDILKESAPKIFDFDFPIFDEEYRLPLEIKILRTYYTREICEETIGLWKLRLQNKLCNIMPYYNQLYKSTLLEFNPFYDVDLQTDHTRKNDGTTNTEGENSVATTLTGERVVDDAIANETELTANTSTNETTTNKTDNDTTSTQNTNAHIETEDTSNTDKTGNEWDEYSDTPQGALSGVRDLTYLTNARHKTGTENVDTTATGKSDNVTTNEYTEANKVEANGNRTLTENATNNGTNNTTRKTTENNTNNGTNFQTTKGESIATNTEEYLQHIKGKQSSMTYSKMLEEYRSTFLNIDKMIIDELSDLFFGLW